VTAITFAHAADKPVVLLDVRPQDAKDAGPGSARAAARRTRA
jgi:hypothetical protein